MAYIRQLWSWDAVSSKLIQSIQFAPDIKNFYFLDGRNRSGEYEKFMREVTLFTVSGKNLHDDSVDALAMLSGNSPRKFTW